MYEDPGNGRYRVYHVSRVRGDALYEYGVEDGSFVPAEPLKDWRKKHRVNWYGTLEQAVELRDQLNGERAKIDKKKVKTEFDVISKTQRIMFANQARKKRLQDKPKPPATRFVMSRCSDCGKVYSGDHRCQKPSTRVENAREEN